MAKPLKKVSNAYWVYYVNEAEAKKRASLNADIDRILEQITGILGIENI